VSARDLRAQHRGQAEKMAGAAVAAVDVPAAAANGGACCHAAMGPGYATPLEAMKKGPREKLVYVTCVSPASTTVCDFCFYHAYRTVARGIHMGHTRTPWRISQEYSQSLFSIQDR